MKYFGLLTVFLLMGCGLFENNARTIPTSSESILVAKAIVHNADGAVLGEILLKETEKGVEMTTQLNSLESGVKAIHIHEAGKCEGPEFESAGAHFNPTKKQHGIENPNGPHAGDLPNLQIEKDGSVQLTFYSPNVTLQKNQPNSLLDEDGSSFIIHQMADDYKTDPAGNSGKRIACGVIH